MRVTSAAFATVGGPSLLIGMDTPQVTPVLLSRTLCELSRPGIDTAFQRGHTAVSTVWGIVGLSLLYLGLRHAGRTLRIGGLALFGLSLAKLLLYDLTSLSSVGRAFSFIAVGALFLVGGFFYQRMDVHSPT